MKTLTISRDRIVDDIRPGDYIVALDGRDLPHPLLVAGWGEVADRNRAGGIALRNRLDTATEWNLYPDSQVAETITVERHRDERGGIEVVTRPVQGETARVFAQAAPSAPETPAQPKPKRTVRRTRYGLTMVCLDGNWRVEDDHSQGLIEVFAYTICEGDHPVRQRVNNDPWDPSKGTHIETGYHHEPTEHHERVGWEVLASREAGLPDDLYPTMDEAWWHLAIALGRYEGGAR